MTKPNTYTYTVLRYVHDTTTGEFVNVGVALFSPDARYASALCRSTYGRLSKMFPGMNTEHFKSSMRHIQARFEELGEQMATELPLEPAQSVLDLARQILPADDSSLQWSPVGVGKTTAPAATLERLFERLVMCYEEKVPRERRTEQDVWRHFKRTLEARQLLHYFRPKTISGRDDEIAFDYTWQNGVLHCLKPEAFDLSSAESIQEKARRLLGHITSVADAPEKFRVYFLVGEPQDAGLQEAFNKALAILDKVTIEKRIFREQDAEKLAALLAKEVAEHDMSAH